MINVGGGDIDGFEKGGHEIKVIPGSVEKLFVPGNLIRDALTSDGAKKGKNEPSVTSVSVYPMQQRLPL